MTKEEHEKRIIRQQLLYKVTSDIKSFGSSLEINPNLDIYIDGFGEIESGRKLLLIKQTLDKYLQEAIDDGYPELTI